MGHQQPTFAHRTVAASALCALLSVAGTPVAGLVAQERDQTTITMVVVGGDCEGCLITPRVSGPGTGAPAAAVTPLPGARVRDGRVTLRVRQAATPGMTFSLRTPRSFNRIVNGEPVAVDAVGLIVVQYAGLPPGSRPTPATARRARSASPCWAGTTAPTVDLTVRIAVSEVTGIQRTGKGEYADVDGVRVAAAWLVPTGTAQGGFGPLAYRGTGLLTEQEPWVCGEPGAA